MIRVILEQKSSKRTEKITAEFEDMTQAASWASMALIHVNDCHVNLKLVDDDVYDQENKGLSETDVDALKSLLSKNGIPVQWVLNLYKTKRPEQLSYDNYKTIVRNIAKFKSKYEEANNASK